MDQKRSACFLGLADLIVDHTLARHHPLEDRLGVVAAAAGAAGVGLYLGDLIPAMEAGLTFAPAGALDRHGLVFADIEVIRVRRRRRRGRRPAARSSSTSRCGWRIASRAATSRWSDRPGPTSIEPPSSSPDCGDRSRSRADRSDRAVAVHRSEDAVTDALAVVEAADRPNGGLCLDIWHSTRRRVPRDRRSPAGHRVMAVQMSDGPLQPDEPDYRDDCLRHRAAPGSGEMDAVGWLSERSWQRATTGPGRWRSATTPSGTAQVRRSRAPAVEGMRAGSRRGHRGQTDAVETRVERCPERSRYELRRGEELLGWPTTGSWRAARSSSCRTPRSTRRCRAEGWAPSS
ncbi:MAG: hypothetical protein R2705_25355 [Ilumatobacteraceae bacterium]